MDFKVIFAPEAIRSLEEVTAWYAETDAVLAEKIGNELIDRVAILQSFPMLGSVYAANPKWRKLVSRPYVIVYRLKLKLHTVEILAFWHSAQGR